MDDNLIMVKNFVLPDLFFEIYFKKKLNEEISNLKIRELIFAFFDNKYIYMSDLKFKHSKAILHIDCYNEIIDKKNLILYLKNNINFKYIEKIVIS